MPSFLIRSVMLLLFVAGSASAQPFIFSIVKTGTPASAATAGETVEATVRSRPAGTYDNPSNVITANSFVDFYNPATNVLVATIPVMTFTTIPAPAGNRYTFNLPVGLAPGGVPTLYNVVVRSRNDAGTTFSTEADPPPVQFTVLPGANIASITPAKSPVNSTAVVTAVLSGATVGAGDTMFLTHPTTGAVVLATSVVTVNATTLRGTFNTTGLTTGLRHLTVRTGSVDLIALNAFEITPAVAVTPGVITQSSTQPVVFTTTSGTFDGTTAVNIADMTGLTADPVVVDSANQVHRTITASPAAPTTTRAVTVVHANGAITSTTSGLTIIPAGLTIVPATGRQGSQATVTLTGTGSDFTVASWTASVSGAGVSAGPMVVANATSASVTLTITAGAAIGARVLTVTNGTQTFQAGFTIQPVTVSISPAGGTRGQDVLVAISGSGTNFVNGTTTVSFAPSDLTLVGAVNVTSPTTATATVRIPPGATLGDRTMTVLTGPLEAPSTTFSVLPVSITAAPGSGNQGSVTTVTITGTNTSFAAGVTVVSVSGSGVTAGAATVNSSTSLTVPLTIAANAASGARTLTVTTGGQSASAPFAINVPSITLNRTAVQQGTSFTMAVTGTNTNFAAGQTTVTFSETGITTSSPLVTGPGLLTTNVTVASDAPTGTRTVSVTTGAQVVTATLQVQGASVTVSPAIGARGSTVAVSITGTNTSFAQGSTTVSVNGDGVTAGVVTVTSPTAATVNLTIAPGATLTPRTLTVTTGSQTSTTNFTVVAAGIAITPTSGVAGRTVPITVTGVNSSFVQGTTTASFSGTGVTAGTVTVTSPTTATLTANLAGKATAGPRTLSMTTGTQTLTAPFDVLSYSIITTPTSSVRNQTFTLSVAGTNTFFAQGQTTVQISGSGVTTGTVQVLSATSLIVPVTVASNATADVRTITITTGAQSSTAQLSIIDNDPRITSVAPASGFPGSSSTVIITGVNTNFSTAAPPTVSFGQGVTVHSVVVDSPTQLTVHITIEANATTGVRTPVVQSGAQTLTSEMPFMIGTGITTSPFQCRATAGVPPVVRAEGLTELVGDLLLTCTGGTAGESRIVNLQVFLNAPITSRILGNDETEALLIIDENRASGAGVTATTPAIYRARRALNNEAAIVWTGIPIVAPGPGQRTLRFTNIRGNAASLGASATLIPTQIIAFLSASPSQSLAINNPQQVVAYVQRGLVADLRTCNGAAAAGDALNLLTCVGQNSSGTRDLLADTSGNLQFAVRFQEGFQTAFKRQVNLAEVPSIPGDATSTESGFVLNDATHPYAVGGASSGTRLTARFTNLPTGVRLFVTTGPSYGSSSSVQAALVQVSGGNTLLPLTPGVAVALPGDRTLYCANVSSAGLPGIEIPVVNGTATAVWEILDADPSANESINFGIAVAYSQEQTARPPAARTSVVLGFAPAYPSGTGSSASAILPIPRFIENTTSTDSFRLDPCTTTLLFPYVASTAGFDTGLAISNTSQDPYTEPNKRLQSGSCTLSFYGRDASGARPGSQRTNRAIEPGETLTVVLSTGGGYGLTAVPSFSGYVFAQCDFLFAHGFAFLTDGPIGAARVAEGYLALVVDGPDSVRGATIGETRQK